MFFEVFFFGVSDMLCFFCVPCVKTSAAQRLHTPERAASEQRTEEVNNRRREKRAVKNT